MDERDHKQRSRVAFDRQASTYDSSGHGRHARRLHAEVVAAVESFPFTAVLDVGCGTPVHLPSLEPEAGALDRLARDGLRETLECRPPARSSPAPARGSRATC